MPKKSKETQHPVTLTLTQAYMWVVDVSKVGTSSTGRALQEPKRSARPSRNAETGTKCGALRRFLYSILETKQKPQSGNKQQRRQTSSCDISECLHLSLKAFSGFFFLQNSTVSSDVTVQSSEHSKQKKSREKRTFQVLTVSHGQFFLSWTLFPLE